MPTKQVPFRLSDADRERLARIREHYGLPSDAAAIRYLIHREAARLAKGGPK